MLVGVIVAIGLLTWLAGRSARRAPGSRLSQAPAVPGWVDRGELARRWWRR